MEDHNPTLRVIKILEALKEEQDGLTLSDIAKRCGLAKGSIFPILHTLTGYKLLRCDPVSGIYRIGIRCYEIGSGYLSQVNMTEEIREITRKVVASCNETCHFAVLEEADVVYLMKEESSQPIRMVSSIGKRMPAYSTAIGKALLSGFGDEEIEALYPEGLQAITEHTITNVKELCRQLEEVRSKQTAYETEESSLNITCIAVPVCQNGRVEAALSVSVPIFRATMEKKAQIEAVLANAKKEMENLIKRVPLHF